MAGDTMERAVTSSLGAMGPVLYQLDSMLDAKKIMPKGVHEKELRALKKGLEEARASLEVRSKAERPSFADKYWMKEVRELSYDTEDYLDMVQYPSGLCSSLQIRWMLTKTKRQRLPLVTTDASYLKDRLEEANTRRKRYQSASPEDADNPASKQAEPEDSENPVPEPEDSGRFVGEPAVTDDDVPDNPAVSNQNEIEEETDQDVSNQAMTEDPVKPPIVSRQTEIVVLDRPVIKQVEITDLDKPVEELVGRLALDTEQQLKLVPIFGSAGVGKTDLARRFYDCYGGRFHCRAFLRVSRKPNTVRLLTSMLSQIKGRQPKGSWDAQAFVYSIKQHLQSKSYLIVVDDLWDTSVWDVLKRAFPEGNCYSRIIITTQIEDVALTSCEDVSGQQFLSNSEGSKNDINQMYNDLHPHLKTCLLYFNMYPEDYVIRKDDLVKQWVAEGFIEVEGSFRPQQTQGSTVEEVPQISVELECTVIEISESPQQVVGAKEDVARLYFDELVGRNMIQPVDISYNRQVLSCTVHHTVLDFIKQKSMEENFTTVMDYPETITGLPGKVRRLSVKFGDAKSAEVPRNHTLSHLRSLVFSGFFKCIPSLVEYLLLRVLILDIWNDQDEEILDLAIIGEMFQLRYLKIECNMIISLPTVIRRLKYLQTLDVAAQVAAFPSDIYCLKDLRHLRLPSQPSPSRGLKFVGHVLDWPMASNVLRHLLLFGEAGLVRRIGDMTSLRSLGNFNLSTCSSYNVRELGNLVNLMDIHLVCSAGPTRLLVSNIECLASVLGKFRELKSLILDDGEVFSNRKISCSGLSKLSSPPVDLERLEFSPRVFIMESLPKWIQQLRNLCTLKISVRELSNDDVGILKELSRLAALSLYVRTTPTKRIRFGKDGFGALKYFKFICNALHMEFLKGAMLKVERLKLGFNANTMQQYRPEDAGIGYLKGLKVISAKIGGASTDQASREAAKRRLVDAFICNHPSLRCLKQNHTRSHCLKENHPQPPIRNIQMVDWIIHGDTEQSSADVTTRGGPDELHKIEETDITEDINRIADSRNTSWEPSPVVQKPGWVSRRQRDVVRLLKTLRVFTYVIRQHMKQAGFRVANEVASLDQDKERLTMITDTSPGSWQQQEWVLQMQDLAYDIQDFLDIYSWLRIGLRRIGSYEIRSYMHALAHMSHIVQLKHRIRSLRERQESGRSSHGRFTRGAASSGPSSSSVPYAYDENDLVGIEEPMTELLNLLLIPKEQHRQLSRSPTKGHNPRVISIVGYHGIGKTALAGAVCYKVHREFDRFAWVVASECSHSGDLLIKICQQVVQERPYYNVPDFYMLKRILQNQRFLVVIDDLQDAGLWYDIQSTFTGARFDSRVIVTTSIGSVANACSPERYIYRMKGLGNFDSEKLFWTRVDSRTNRTPSLEYALADNLRKCGGVPLALISVANYVCRKGQNLPPGAPGAFEEMNTVLTQCYDSLPDNGHKMCLLSLSTFPQGHLIKRERLIRRWIAEGLAVGDGVLSAEQVAGNRFDVLIDRNIIEPVLNGNNAKVKGCLVLGVIKDLVVNKSVSKEFLTLIRNDELLHPNKKVSRPVRRLSVDGGTTHSERVAKGIGLDRVRSLTICNTVPFDFKDCWLLRVLDLEDCQGVDKRVLHNICKLVFLKYLSLRGSDVYKISKKIKKLECLETLDIRETRVETLPVEVFLLPRLAHLFGQFELPRQLEDRATRSKLQAFFSQKSRIQTLSGFVMVEKNGFEHIMLNMRLLRKVKIWCKHSITSYQEHLLTSLLQKRLAGSNALDSLSINFGTESINFLNDIGAPGALIGSLKLRGRLISLPSFINSHDTTLSELQLSSTRLTIEALSLLQNLHRLLYLKLADDGDDGFCGDGFVVQSGGFPSLLRLCFEARKLPQIHIHEGGMSSLTYLRLLCPEFAGCKNADSGEKLKGVDPETWFEETDSSQRIIKRIDLKSHFKGIQHLKRLNEVVLHPSAAQEVLHAWEEVARSHINRPKITAR